MALKLIICAAVAFVFTTVLILFLLRRAVGSLDQEVLHPIVDGACDRCRGQHHTICCGFSSDGLPCLCICHKEHMKQLLQIVKGVDASRT